MDPNTPPNQPPQPQMPPPQPPVEPPTPTPQAPPLTPQTQPPAVPQQPPAGEGGQGISARKLGAVGVLTAVIPTLVFVVIEIFVDLGLAALFLFWITLPLAFFVGARLLKKFGQRKPYLTTTLGMMLTIVLATIASVISSALDLRYVAFFLSLAAAYYAFILSDRFISRAKSNRKLIIALIVGFILVSFLLS